MTITITITITRVIRWFPSCWDLSLTRLFNAAAVASILMLPFAPLHTYSISETCLRPWSHSVHPYLQVFRVGSFFIKMRYWFLGSLNIAGCYSSMPHPCSWKLWHSIRNLSRLVCLPLRLPVQSMFFSTICGLLFYMGKTQILHSMQSHFYVKSLTCDSIQLL
jgi:hypothetical protein